MSDGYREHDRARVLAEEPKGAALSGARPDGRRCDTAPVAHPRRH
ncbi:hypothetical protein ABT266_48650 [Amycolatopsis sp. NPDC000746]